MEHKTKKQEESIVAIEFHFAEIMKALGLDIGNDSLKNTPKRVAKMLVTETCSSLFTDKPNLTTFENSSEQIDQIVIVRDIQLNSLCEHHFMPIVGKVHIGYMPSDKIIGLSKMNRITQYVGSRPQVQERIVSDIYKELSPIIGENIIIVAEAVHFCSCARGPRDTSSSTVTSFAGGVFRDEKSIKDEFFNLLKL